MQADTLLSLGGQGGGWGGSSKAKMGCGATKTLAADAELTGVVAQPRTRGTPAKDRASEDRGGYQPRKPDNNPTSPQASSPANPLASRRPTIVRGTDGPFPGSLAPASDAESECTPHATPTTRAAEPPIKPPSKLDPALIESSHLCFLHFNDVYHITASAKEPVGGAAKFSRVVKDYKKVYGAEVLFSGDCYNPSLMSTVTKGKHMTPILNELDMQCAVYGNHDFDFGLDVLKELTAASNAPWLMSNVVDVSGPKEVPAADGKMTHTYVHKSRYNNEAGVKVGIIGVGEEEWLSCVKDLPDFIQYRDAVEVANREAARLRKEGCDLIVVLSHMRHNNDLDFLARVPGCDLLLGGHDHFYRSDTLETGQVLVKSGTDFKNLSFIAVEVRKGQRPVFHVERIDVTSDLPDDPAVYDIVKSYEQGLQGKLSKEICFLESEMDITTETVRTAESGMGNMICDIMRDHTNAECAFVNSGILRADVVYHPGALTIKDLLDIVPIEDVIVSVNCTGQQMLSALENGVSKWPQQEGRFLQMSGIGIKVDPARAPGDRILECSVGGRPLELGRTYSAATTAFLCKGCDGFSALCGAEYNIDPENGPILPTLVRRSIEDMVPKDVASAKRASLAELSKNVSATKMNREDRKSAVDQIRRSALPSIRPQVVGRIHVVGVTKTPPASAVFSFGSNPAPESKPASPLYPLDTLPLSSAPPKGPVGTVLADLGEVKKRFKDLATRLPSTTIEWSLELLPYVGQQGEILASFPDVGVAQIKFVDGASFWLPMAAVSELASGFVDIAPSPAPQPAPHPVNNPRPHSAIGFRRGPQRTLSADFSRRLGQPVPRERTLSFIFHPVGTDDMVTQKDINERGKSRSAGAYDPDFGENVGEHASMSEFDEIQPHVPGTTIYDMIWDGNLEGVEAFLAAGNESYVNRKGVGNPASWSTHSVNHCFYGLGKNEHESYPLHYAAARGNTELVKLLLDCQADKRVRNDAGFTPRETACARLTVAMCKGNSSVVQSMEDVIATLDTYKPVPRNCE
ncbi:Trifunctional nucleotide phosphoesterase protein YfkN [Diplonema papillatum]|nr:Trifunctional nucleotide phosphoesterase protein YfkN [Diplonema papillatum]